MKDIFKILWQEIRKRDNFLITSHISPDGDNIGSCVAWYEVLTSMGKKAFIRNQDKLPDKYEFIYEGIDIRNADEQSESFDNVIILDIGAYKRVGKVRDLISKDAFIINIDHHESNDKFGDIAIVDPYSASTTQLLFEIFKFWDISLSKRALEALYMGILTDTGGFRHQNTDQRLFLIAAEIVAGGISPAYVMRNTFNNNSLDYIKNSCEAVSKSVLEEEYLLLTTYLDNSDEKLLESDLVLELMSSVREAEVFVFIREEKDKFKLSLRSKNEFNLSKFAGKYGGGGHPKAAGISLNEDLDFIYKVLLEDLKKELKKFYE